jgi:hypothetical protein
MNIVQLEGGKGVYSGETLVAWILEGVNGKLFVKKARSNDIEVEVPDMVIAEAVAFYFIRAHEFSLDINKISYDNGSLLVEMRMPISTMELVIKIEE